MKTNFTKRVAIYTKSMASKFIRKNYAPSLLGIFLLVAGQATAQEYCTPQFTSTAGLTCDNYRLRNVVIGDINNDVTGAACSVSDYLSLSTTHAPGETVDFSITIGNYMSFAIYADFNLDGDFNDANEMLFAGHPDWLTTVETVTSTFDIPTDTEPGTYRMRVVGIWGDNPENPPITEGQACATFVREGNGNYHDYTLVVGEAAATYNAAVTITSGFNHDIIANGVGNASQSTTMSFDQTNTRALVSLDFQATSGASFPTYGLPANGEITSAVTTDVTFQLADYSGNNALFLTPDYVGTGTNTGTLAFSAQNVTDLYFLAGCAGGGMQTLPFTATVNFSDETSQTASLMVNDWYNGTGSAIQGIGRINTSNNNLEGDASNPRLYEITLAIDEENQEKTVTGITFTFNGDSTAEWASEIRMSILAVNITATEAPASAECVFTPLSLTGFNHDVVAEGTGGDANDKTTHPIDGANAFYAQDFVPTNPHSSGASAAAYGGGLPNNGMVSSSATEGLTYQLTSYSENNGLVLRNTTSNTGTLELTEQKKAERVYVAWVSAEGANSVDVQVNFADGSSQTFAGQNATDWWSTSPDASTVAMGSLGRISVITTAAWAPLNSFSGLTQTQLFQTEFTLNEENYNKLISSVTFTKATSSNDATTTAVIAISICETQSDVVETSVVVTTQDDALPEITENEGTLQLIATVTPEEETVLWTVEQGTEYAFVDENGLVTAIADGTVVVRATLSSDDTVYDEIEITVSNQNIDVTAIEVVVENDAEPTITEENGTLQLLAVITPEDATVTDVTWSVEEGTDFVYVDENGLVTALASGTATVRATSADNAEVYGELEVVVTIEALGTIDFNTTTFTVYPNPVSSVLYINANSNVNEVKVYNMLGQEVYTGTSNEINLQDLQAGYYVVKVRFENNTLATSKILKN
ncbi:T9SS type A sorting domain-containing protein [Flavobacterium alkalisoli]|uniref:T9SS type A sorting domain-containing protein n=1 Tax=Flavobacterium alkalisoli TaxID=2602769 RepID=A0A5B9FY98_9FLAO|nr:Ig-like domain-containing protein [Flavobacterium alkalisoli]QEE49852.1 T9SS type A sorting domain-containing protein [Flavobacterium alkalisoli]